MVAGFVGAVLGTVARYLTLAAWPAPRLTLVTTLIIVALACLAWGALSTTDMRRAVAAATAGFAGSFASLSILAAVALLSSPLLCGLYVLLTPIAAIVGLGLGLALGLAVRPAEVHADRTEAATVVDNA